MWWRNFGVRPQRVSCAKRMVILFSYLFPTEAAFGSRNRFHHHVCSNTLMQTNPTDNVANSDTSMPIGGPVSKIIDLKKKLKKYFSHKYIGQHTTHTKNGGYGNSCIHPFGAHLSFLFAFFYSSGFDLGTYMVMSRTGRLFRRDAPRTNTDTTSINGHRYDVTTSL